jgi:hypothetical protein
MKFGELLADPISHPHQVTRLRTAENTPIQDQHPAQKNQLSALLAESGLTQCQWPLSHGHGHAGRTTFERAARRLADHRRNVRITAMLPANQARP